MIRIDLRLFLSLVCGLFIISLFLYWPSPKMGFVLDDHYVIAANPVIKDPALYPKILTGGLFDASRRTPESKLNYYRPVLTASFAADYSLWGLNTVGYRMVNIVLHVINCILIFGMLVLIFRNISLASLAALIFCILPTHEWVVRYIVGRGDLLQAFFSLVSFISIICHCERRKGEKQSQIPDGIASPKGLLAMTRDRRWQYLSWAAFVLAMLSREAAVINVAFVFLIIFYVTRNMRRTLQGLIPFILLAGAYYLLRSIALPIVGGASVLFGLDQGIAAASSLVMHLWGPALVTGVLPHGIFLTVVIALGTVGLLMAILLRPENQEEAPIAGFALLWIAAGVLPLLVAHRMVERLGPVLSEHFLYFASIGFALLLAFILEHMRAVLARKILFVGFLTYFLAVGLVNGMSWQSEERLLRHVQRIEGKDFTVAFEQIAMRFDNDENNVLRLINQVPSEFSRSLWFKRLGNMYHQRLDFPSAIAALNEAVRLNPSNVDALNELAVVYLESEDSLRGMAYLKQSLAIDPEYFDTHRLLGTAFYVRGNFPDAIDAFKKSLSLNPDQMEASLYLMMAYFFGNDERSYQEMLERATQRFHDERAILRFVANQLFDHGRFAETVKILEPTKALFANDPRTLAILTDAQRRLRK